MEKFKTFTGPYGIPVYYQHLPDIVQSVSMGWVVFTGAADDESVGSPGLYHWFEHVPFRGTTKYPNGYADTKGRFTKYGGILNAQTNTHLTQYHVSLPVHVWKEGLSVITSLFSQPLLRDNDIRAERDIINQEIRIRLGSSKGYAGYHLGEILWPGHPFGHHTLGSEETLASMSAPIMIEAHRKGYDRSRCMLVVVGNIPEQELRTELQNLAPVLPDHGLPERRRVTDHGPLPAWRGGVTTVRETQFASSIVMMLFPLPAEISAADKFFRYSNLADLFEFGQLTSPLYRILREERKLVYSVEVEEHYCPGGGYFCFRAETQSENVDRVAEAFKDVISDPAVRSQERIEEIREGISNTFKMNPLDPSRFRDKAVRRFSASGQIVNDSDYLDSLRTLTTEHVENMLSRMTPENAHVVVFKGMGK